MSQIYHSWWLVCCILRLSSLTFTSPIRYWVYARTFVHFCHNYVELWHIFGTTAVNIGATRWTLVLFLVQFRHSHSVGHSENSIGKFWKHVVNVGKSCETVFWWNLHQKNVKFTIVNLPHCILVFERKKVVNDAIN